MALIIKIICKISCLSRRWLNSNNNREFRSWINNITVMVQFLLFIWKISNLLKNKLWCNNFNLDKIDTFRMKMWCIMNNKCNMKKMCFNRMDSNSLSLFRRFIRLCMFLLMGSLNRMKSLFIGYLWILRNLSHQFGLFKNKSIIDIGSFVCNNLMVLF